MKEKEFKNKLKEKKLNYLDSDLNLKIPLCFVRDHKNKICVDKHEMEKITEKNLKELTKEMNLKNIKVEF